ncbi:monocarboxylate transporter 3-like isoform X3 [Daphnia pulicaria]|uniref:monocarboxylate transporter 3-like isoform X3 n=1 Tax=Daphnia pulicaria TaxID=35523 RepID=UPI001EE9CF22|nr:monocarboxylate transporter 3-like isoform X3 [Daphnia pulicaria]
MCGKNHHCGRSGTAGGDPSNANSGGGGGGGHHNNSEVGDDALSGLGGLNDDKISGGPGLNERELWSLHRAVPGLRRHDPRTSTIRQHYYPEGGWGWLVVGAAFLVQVLTTGLQLAFGVMAAQIARHFSRQDSSAAASSLHMEAVWIGVIQLSGSWLWTPLVVALCRRKSTRLTAVLGGLVLALAALFASFAQQLHQVFLSYGALMSIAIALVRESSALMVGQYFKRRRDFVEIVVQMGAGIGVILFSVFFKEALGQMGWRLGLQAATGLLLSAFFLGTFYRSASLYHPQRRAILHLKTQRKKVKVKGKPSNDRPPYFDFSVLRLKSLRMILLSSGIGAIGAYTPLFYLALQGEEDGLEASDLLLIHTFMGLAMAAGTVIVGLVVLRPSPQCLISLQYLCQATLYGIGLSLLALATVNGYHGYVLFAWLYGFCLGGYQYAVHQYTLDRVRARQFARGWSLVLAVRSLPTLFGVPIAGYINQSTPRAGYYFSFTFTVIGASLLFLSKMYRRAAPPNLFLGRRSSPPSFHHRSSDGAGSSGHHHHHHSNHKESRDKCSQEPLIYRSQMSNGSSSAAAAASASGQPVAHSSSIRTVHQDVCTCTQPPPPPPPPPPPHLDNQDPLKLPKNLGRRIALKLGLHAIPWKRNPIAEFFNGTPDMSLQPMSHGQHFHHPTACPLKQSASNPGYPFDIEWDAEYWNGCLGSCNHLAMEGECDICQSCADCGLPLDDDDDYIDDDCQIHSGMQLPDAIDIPELPPEVKRYRMLKRSLREMSLSDPELLQKAGTCDYGIHYREQGIPRLPPKLLRRQNTWHDVSVLTRDVDVIEQITTSV